MERGRFTVRHLVQLLFLDFLESKTSMSARRDRFFLPIHSHFSHAIILCHVRALVSLLELGNRTQLLFRPAVIASFTNLSV